MADHSNPVTTQTDANVLASIRDIDDDQARLFQPGLTSPTNQPVGTIRWNDSTNKLEIYNGSPPSWGDLTTGLNMPLLTSKSTYTPTISFATPGTSSISYGSQSGAYYRVGKLVFVAVRITFTPTIGSGSGTIRISLPSTPDSEDYIMAIGELSRVGASDGWTWPSLTGGAAATSVSMLVNSTAAFIRALGDSGLGTTMTVSALTNGSAHTISFSGWYAEP